MGKKYARPIFYTLIQLHITEKVRIQPALWQCVFWQRPPLCSLLRRFSFWNPSHPLAPNFSGNPDARNTAGTLVNLGLMYEAKGGETVNKLALQFFTTTDRVLESNPDFVDRCVLMFPSYLCTCVLVMHDYMHPYVIPWYLQYLLSDAISSLSRSFVSTCQY